MRTWSPSTGRAARSSITSIRCRSATSSVAGSASSRTPASRRSATSRTASKPGRKSMAEAAPEFVYTVYIAAPAERVWNALVDGDVTRRYWGHENRSDWQPGSRWEHVRVGPDGVVDVAGKVIEIDPPHRLVTSWHAPDGE